MGRADGKTCQQPQVVRVYNIIIGHIEYIFDMFSQITYMAENKTAYFMTAWLTKQ